VAAHMAWQAGKKRKEEERKNAAAPSCRYDASACAVANLIR